MFLLIRFFLSVNFNTIFVIFQWKPLSLKNDKNSESEYIIVQLSVWKELGVLHGAE